MSQGRTRPGVRANTRERTGFIQSIRAATRVPIRPLKPSTGKIGGIAEKFLIIVDTWTLRTGYLKGI